MPDLTEVYQPHLNETDPPKAAKDWVYRYLVKYTINPIPIGG